MRSPKNGSYYLILCIGQIADFGLTFERLCESERAKT